MRTDKKIEKIIEEAEVDIYDEWEALAAWDSLLTDNITVPQDCKVNGNDGRLVKICSDDKSVCGQVKFASLKKSMQVALSDIELGNKAQDIYIRAYEEGFC